MRHCAGMRTAAALAMAAAAPAAWAVLPPSVYKERIEKSKIKAIAVVKAVAVERLLQGAAEKRVTFELEKTFAGRAPKTFTGRCLSRLPWGRPPVGPALYYSPRVGDRVYVTVSRNGGDITSYTRMTPRLEEALRVDPRRVKPGVGEVVVEDGAKKIVEAAAAWADKGEHQRALRKLEEAFRITSTYAQAYYVRGRVLAKAGRYAEAAADLEKAGALDSDWAWPLNSLAWLLITCPDPSVRNPKKALAAAQKALQRERSHQILDTLACAYAANGDFPRAVKVEQDAVAACRDPKIRAQYVRRLEGFRLGKTYLDQQKRK